MITSYQKLHDGLSNMIEGGRLTESDIPDDYQWLVESLASLANPRHDPLTESSDIPDQEAKDAVAAALDFVNDPTE